LAAVEQARLTFHNSAKASTSTANLEQVLLHVHVAWKVVPQYGQLNNATGP
jgi:hypothetical protein